MKRLAFVMVAALAPGCVGFNDYEGYGQDGYYHPGYNQGGCAPAPCGCQASAASTVSTASGRSPAVSPIPSVQTREPELLGKQ